MYNNAPQGTRRDLEAVAAFCNRDAPGAIIGKVALQARCSILICLCGVFCWNL